MITQYYPTASKFGSLTFVFFFQSSEKTTMETRFGSRDDAIAKSKMANGQYILFKGKGRKIWPWDVQST